MSRSTYTPKMEYTGDGTKNDYTFSFKIEELSQLLVVEYDDTGLETQRVRGTDVTYISSVVFDAVDGAGTVNLTTNLTNLYKLKILLANDAPTQPTELREKFDFTLKTFENALDWISGAVSRVAYLSQRSIKINDYTDLSAFDPTLPNIVADTFLKINGAADGMQLTGILSADTTLASVAEAQAATNDLKYMSPSKVKSTLDYYKILDSGPNLLHNIAISASAAGGAMSIGIKSADGATEPTSLSPARIGFRNNTIAAVGYHVENMTSGSSMSIPSGATLGYANGDDCWIYVYATSYLTGFGVALGYSSVAKDESILHTSLDSTAASDSSALYTGTPRTNLAIRLLAVIKVDSITTAGTWTAPSEIRMNTGNGIERKEVLSVNSGGLTNYSGTASQWYDLMSVTLTPGTYRGFTMGSFFSNGVTTTGAVLLGLSIVPGNVAPGGGNYGSDYGATTKRTASGTDDFVSASIKEIVMTATNTYYAKAFAGTSVTNLQVGAKLEIERVI